MLSRLYRAALYVYPPRFRREFAADMAADFDDARRDGIGRPGLIVDLAGSLIVQWLRTGLPAIVLLAVAWPVVLLSAVARLWRPIFFQLPPRSHDADVLVLMLLVTVVLLVVIATVMFTLCFAIRPITRRRRR